MSILDKIQVGSTTYDLQDSKATADIVDLKSALDSDIALIGEKHLATANFLPPDFVDGFIKSTGSESNPPSPSFKSANFVEVASGETIIFMQQTDLSAIYVAEYGQQKDFIKRTTVYTNSGLQLDSLTKYIKVASDVMDASTAETKKIGLAYSNAEIDYEPYEMVFKINNGVGLPDYVDLKFDELESDISDVVYEASTNLIPPIYEDGFITSTGSETNPEDSCRSKDYIPVIGGSYIIQMNSNNTLSSVYIATYNAQKVFQTRYTVKSTEPTQLPSNIAFIRFATNGLGKTAILSKDIGVAYSQKPIAYTAYELKTYLGDNVLIKGVHKHNNMKWCAMGDSITEGTYSDSQGAHVVPSQTWVAIVSELCQYDTDNKGIGGTGWVKKGAQGDKKNAREQVADIDFANYDLVTLSFGVNDWKGGVTWGTMDDSPSLGGTIYSNMKYVIEKIITDNPYAKVIVITPLNCRQGKSELATETTNYAIGYDYDGHTLQDMFDLEKQVCEHYGIQYIDMTHTSIINRVNAVSATPDAVHPSLDAHRCIAYQTANSLMYNN